MWNSKYYNNKNYKVQQQRSYQQLTWFYGISFVFIIAAFSCPFNMYVFTYTHVFVRMNVEIIWLKLTQVARHAS